MEKINCCLSPPGSPQPLLVHTQGTSTPQHLHHPHHHPHPLPLTLGGKALPDKSYLRGSDPIWNNVMLGYHFVICMYFVDHTLP